MRRTRAQQRQSCWNSFRGSSQPEQHSVSCYFIGCQGAPFTSYWLKAGFQVSEENKGLDCLTRLEEQQREHCKESFSHPFSPPIFSVIAALNYTFFFHPKRVHTSLAESDNTNSHLSDNRKQLFPVCSVLTWSSEKLNTLPWYAPSCPDADML